MKSSAILIGVVVVLAVVDLAGVAILPTKQYLLQFIDAVQQMGSWGPVGSGSGVCGGDGIIRIRIDSHSEGAVFFGVCRSALSTISVGSTLGAAAAFGLGRTLLRDVIAAKVAKNESFALIDAAVGEQGFKIVLLTRLSPVFPFNLLNYSFGLTRVSFRDYILASWIGMLPGTAMYVYIGSTLKSFGRSSPRAIYDGGLGQKLLYGFGLIMTVVATIFITRIAQRSLRDALPANAPTEHH